MPEFGLRLGAAVGLIQLYRVGACPQYIDEIGHELDVTADSSSIDYLIQLNRVPPDVGAQLRAWRGLLPGVRMRKVQQPLREHILDVWLARGAIVVTAALNAILINKLSFVPWWLGSTVELTLLVPLSIATAWTHVRMRRATTEHHWASIHRHSQIIRWAALFLTAIITLINFEALRAVLHALLYGTKGANGQTLLIDALNIWFTNVVVFALWFWNLDGGGPARRAVKLYKEPDFMFPQMATNLPGYESWVPGFLDYLFVSFTNATAFSPTDSVPLSVRSKLLFMVESCASLLTVGLVAARAVNILS
jgi:hypothetical protein